MKMFLKSLLVSFGLLFSPVIQTNEPRVEHINPDQNQPESYTALRLEHLRLAQQAKHSQNRPTSDLLPHQTQKLTAPLHKGDGPTIITSNDELTAEERAALNAAEERAALNAEEHHSFIHETTPLSTTHITDHHAQLNFIRTKIIQHLTNELSTIKLKLTAEQIKSREMVIKFFDKAGELTTEGLAKFHNIYKKLAKWEKGTELTLTPEEQKEMKLFLQNLVTTYCTKHQTLEKAA